MVLGNLTGLLARIKPAVAQTKYDGEKSSKNYAYVDAVGETNVRLAVAEIHRRSPILEDLSKKGSIAIAGAMYDLADRRSQVPGVGRWSVSKIRLRFARSSCETANDPLLLILRSSHIGIGLSATASRPGIVCSPKDTLWLHKPRRRHKREPSSYMNPRSENTDLGYPSSVPHFTAWDLGHPPTSG